MEPRTRGSGPQNPSAADRVRAELALPRVGGIDGEQTRVNDSAVTDRRVTYPNMARPSDPTAKTRLLQAAEKVFVENGLDRARVEEIASAAGVSKGSFYLHFKSKEHAFNEILGEVLDILGQALGSMEDGLSRQQGKSHEAIIAEWFEQDLRFFEYVWERRGVVRLVLEGGGSPDHRHLTEVFAQHAEEATVRFIRHGVSRGYYRPDIDPVYAATFIAGGYDRLARRLVSEAERPDLRLWIAEAQAMCLRALGTPDFIASTVSFHQRLLASDLGDQAVG